ncbi:MAG: UGMP family protein [Thermoplasmata archaeon HGW-Thermoplasmata-1]|nr:MAG: UGMP family protein [Thermoplasmata archaeon HGW-Thermoplasmata-1]
MIALGIEGTAHSLGVGIVTKENGKCRVLSNVIKMHRPAEGGIHPREAANHHAEQAPLVLAEAVEKAGISLSEVDLVSFSQGPGLGPCLRTAATAARALAVSLGKPIIGVNHCVAHIEIGCGVTDCTDPILLYASGANTQIIAFTNGKYRVFGETLDIGIGNCLDKFARDHGIPFPGGPEIEKLARAGRKYLELPYSVKGMDLAFSGILSSAAQYIKRGETVEDVCYSIQETTFAMLTEVAERAMAHTEKNEILLGGGVACNARLQEMVNIMARERGAQAYVPPKPLCVDNGAMIGWMGIVMHEAGVRMSLAETTVNQRYRTDDVHVTWRSG